MKLTDIRILVTRPDPQGSVLCQEISNLGGQAIAFPTIAFAPPPSAEAFQRSISNLGEQEWLIFISPQAVYASIPDIRRAWPQFPSNVKFAAVGGGTAKALHAAGYNVTVQPNTEWSSQGLLDLAEFQSLTGKKIAIIRGVGGRELLDKVLTERGAQILPVIAYARILPASDPKVCLALLAQHQIDVIVCTSFDGVRNLKIMLGAAGWPYIKELPIVVMSERIKMLAQDLGFQTIWVTRNASQNAILEIIAENCQKRK